jgi:hypothetical protein
VQFDQIVYGQGASRFSGAPFDLPEQPFSLGPVDGASDFSYEMLNGTASAVFAENEFDLR